MGIGFKAGRDHSSFFTIIILLLCLCASPALGGQTASQRPEKLGPRNKSEDWVRYEVNGIPYEVALEWVMGKENGWFSNRVLFVYLEPHLFTKDNVLAVAGNISSKIPLSTTLNITLLADKDLLKKRVNNYSGTITSHDTSYTRLTDESDTCCPQNFIGAQFDRGTTQARLVLCISGYSQEINAEIENRSDKNRKVRRVRSKP